MDNDRKKILVVEDDNEIRHNLSAVLKLNGYDTHEAVNGSHGLSIAKNFKPNLIISDIMMPEMDGFEMLKQIQDDSDISHTPFLFLSARSDKFAIREGMNLGADDFITKPYDVDELLTAVKIRIDKKEKREAFFKQKIDSLQTNLKRSMPHEIRTPLNIILGMSEFLLKNYDETERDEAVEMLENISEAGRRLHRMLENYLYLANLELIAATPDEKAKLFSNSTMLVRAMIKDIVAYKSYLANRESDFILDLDEVVLNMSEHYLAKIIDEITDNCLKFSQAGSKIDIKSVFDSKYYKITFTDHGIGMSSNQIKSIDAYIQFERKLYEQQGSGLGLTIVKKIIEMHNGKFMIESQKNEFTRVSIWLPVSQNYD